MYLSSFSAIGFTMFEGFKQERNACTNRIRGLLGEFKLMYPQKVINLRQVLPDAVVVKLVAKTPATNLAAWPAWRCSGPNNNGKNWMRTWRGVTSALPLMPKPI